MKISIYVVLIAFLLGIALFGIFKSITLLKHNMELNQAVGRLTLDLETTQSTLKETKQALSDAYLKNSELEGGLKDSQAKLEQKEEELKNSIAHIAQLTEKLKEVVGINEDLSRVNADIQDRTLRTELENSEMKKKLSSVDEMKKAIKELRIKIREEKRKKRVKVVPQKKQKEEKPVPVQPPKPLLQQSEPLHAAKISLDNTLGNKGFFIKDGKSTFEDLVDIRVVPMDANTY